MKYSSLGYMICWVALSLCLYSVCAPLSGDDEVSFDELDQVLDQVGQLITPEDYCQDDDVGEMNPCEDRLWYQREQCYDHLFARAEHVVRNRRSYRLQDVTNIVEELKQAETVLDRRYISDVDKQCLEKVKRYCGVLQGMLTMARE